MLKNRNLLRANIAALINNSVHLIFNFTLLINKMRVRWLPPVIIISIVMLLRIPAILSHAELNVDESLLAAQSFRYGLNPTPWGGVDSTTSGPLNTLPFYLISVFLGPWTFQGIHVFAAGVVSLMGLLTWKILRRMCCAETSLFGLASFILFVAVAQSSDYVHFSSELIPATLLAASTYCLIRIKFYDWSKYNIWLYSGCMLAGSAPLAKLQAAPISLVFLIYASLVAYIQSNVQPRAKLSKIIPVCCVILAWCLPSLLILSIVVTSGAMQDFLQSYILRNLFYSQGSNVFSADGSYTDFFRRAIHVFVRESPIRGITLGLAAISSVWAFLRFPGWHISSRMWRLWLIFLSFQLIAALFSVAKPVYEFPHYNWFLLVPGILLSTAILQTWYSYQQRNCCDSGRNASSLANILLAFMLVASLHATHLYRTEMDIQQIMRNMRHPNEIYSLVSEKISARASGSKSLGIWGWAPALYINTTLAPASRHAIGHYLIEDSPQRNHFRQSFIEDLKNSKPRVFVDTVVPGFFLWLNWTKDDRLESFPGLADMIANEYRLAEEVLHPTMTEPVRIYLRKDAIKE